MIVVSLLCVCGVSFTVSFILSVQEEMQEVNKGGLSTYVVQMHATT